jgi:hypothetical protein
MSEQEASRTLVKSPPELWAECSDARSLARHLGDAVGEIRIKRLEPETTVAWEGEQVSGTVRLEPAGWGTKVTLTAASEAPAVVPEAELEPEPEPVAAPEPATPEPTVPEPATPEPTVPQPAAPDPPRTGFVARFRRWFASTPTEAEPAGSPPAPEPSAPAPPEPEPEPAAPTPPEPEAVREPDPVGNEIDLTAALDSLGKAHHRPFSRA